MTLDAKSQPSQPPESAQTPDPVPPRITILSELDSYITERMKEQPASLEEAVQRLEVRERAPRHRMKLSPYFESLSADNPKGAGAYVFRWVFKTKRSVDDHLAKGWLLVNRSYFPKAPRYLFTANGGIELGDVLLAFMPVKQAKAIREAPAKLSQERLKSRMTQTKPDYLVMTGNQDRLKDGSVYAPELGPETAETSEERPPGVMTEGRDF